MPITLERSIFKTGSSPRVNISEPVAKTLDLKASHRVLISLNDHQMIPEKSRKTK